MLKNFIICIAAFSSSLFGQETSYLLPDSVVEWKKEGAAEIYVENELFRLIDGGADIFLEYGFNSIITQRYKDSGEGFIDVEIYEMKDSSSAYGIFSLFTLNTGEKIDFNTDAFAGDEFLLFWKGNFYVGLTAINLPENPVENMLILARSIEERLSPAAKPDLINIFKAYGIRPAYFKGSLGFYNISGINLGKQFRIEEGIYFSKGAVNSYIFSYASEDECIRNYNRSLETLDSNSNYLLNSSKPDLYVYTEEKNCLLLHRIGTFIVLLVSDDLNDSEKFLLEIQSLLQQKS